MNSRANRGFACSSGTFRHESRASGEPWQSKPSASSSSGVVGDSLRHSNEVENLIGTEITPNHPEIDI